MSVSREEIARAVGTIADLDGGQKRAFPEIAREIGVSPRMVRKWRALEAECPDDARLQLLQLQAERLAARLAETRQMLKELRGTRDRLLVPAGDDVRRHRASRGMAGAALRETDATRDSARAGSEVAA